MARRTAVDLSEQLIELVAEGYRTGMPMAQVAGLVGVHKRTLDRWVSAGQDEIARRAEDPESEPPDDPRLDQYVALATAIKAADARFVQENLLLIRRAATEGKQIRTTTKTNTKGATTTETVETVGGLWAAAAWLLERRHTQEFGRQIRQLEVSGPGGGPVMVDESAEARISEKLDAYYQGVKDGRDMAAEAAETPAEGS